jgi:serine/threonine-protein kinase
MGEVYRARDTKLGRDVAIKVLPASVTNDSDRLARFSREAQVLAALNHPNIASIYHVEEMPDGSALVMELVEGETLADRITRGAIPIDEALSIARQIAEALEAAHEQGIIHRDLKPANIKVRDDGTVKVLDFGLAKLAEANSSNLPSAPNALSMSPTITSPALVSGVGLLLGTAAYMSPEQAKGKSADQRSDIWAFGCVLYEMLTGRQAFQGDSVAEVMASVLKSDVDLTILPPQLNPKVVELIRRCLAKDPKRRWHAAADVRMEIEAILTDPRGVMVRAEPTAAHKPLWKRAIPVAATAALAAAISAAVAWNMRPAPAGSITRFSIVLPDSQQLTRLGRHNIALSPDGQNIVYVANDRLYLRAMGDIEARPIQGTEQDVNTPFFSPDGRWIGFWAAPPENKLKKIPVTGGASVTIADTANPFGATWESGDQILVGQGARGIVRVSANGGKPETIVKMASGEVAHGPQMLPDGDHVLFTLAKGIGASRWDQAQIVVQSLRTGARTVLINGGSDARYVPTGHIVYALGNNLLAIPFDERSLAVTGSPVPILEGIARSTPGNTAASYFSFSRSGAMAHFVGTGIISATSNRSMALVNRKGTSMALPMPPQPYAAPRISPDGRQLAVAILTGNESNIWIYDLVGTLAPRRLTFGADNFGPAWTPDGRRILFISTRDDNSPAIFWQPADGSGSAERLTDPKAVQPTSIRPSSDAKHVIYRDTRGDGDIWMLPLEGDRKAQPVITGRGNQDDAILSPNGHWMVYESGESGRTQVYVQPFPPSGAKYQITTATAAYDPVWSRDGRQIFYLEPQDAILFRLMSVDVRTESGFTFANPTRLFEGVSVAPGGAYDAMPDGQRFVVLVRPGDANQEPAANPEIRVTLNWFEELRQRVPTK